MKTKNTIKKLAKKLYTVSILNGEIDRNRVHAIVATVLQSATRNKTTVLKQYKKYIEAFVRTREVIVEVPDGFAIDRKMEQEIMEKTHAKNITVYENAGLIFGVKITHGDWVYDNTLDSQLGKIVG